MATKTMDQLFEVYDVIGTGAFANVRRVRRKEDGRLLVLKTLRARVDALSDEERRDMINEVDLLSELNHPNVIQYFGSFVENSNQHIVMEYAAGGALVNVLNQARGPLPEDQIWEWFSQMCIALRYVHNCNILHRDIKPQNILLWGPRGRVVKLADFGIAKVLSNSSPAGAQLVGTPYYLAPEICSGGVYTQKSDVWALACVLYEMLSLSKPFQSPNLPQLALQIIREPHQPLNSIALRTYSDAIRDLIDLMLQKDSDDRPDMHQLCAIPVVRHKMQLWDAIRDTLIQTEAREVQQEADTYILSRRENMHNEQGAGPNAKSTDPSGPSSGTPYLPSEAHAESSNNNVLLKCSIDTSGPDPRAAPGPGQLGTLSLGGSFSRFRSSTGIGSGLNESRDSGMSFSSMSDSEARIIMSLFIRDGVRVFRWGSGQRRPKLDERIYLASMQHNEWVNVESIACTRFEEEESETHHTLVLTEDGQVLSLGCNSSGQLGISPSSLDIAALRQLRHIRYFSDRSICIASVACGSAFSAAVSRDGKVYMWGDLSDLGDHSELELKFEACGDLAQDSVFAEGMSEASSLTDEDTEDSVSRGPSASTLGMASLNVSSRASNLKAAMPRSSQLGQMDSLSPQRTNDGSDQHQDEVQDSFSDQGFLIDEVEEDDEDEEAEGDTEEEEEEKLPEPHSAPLGIVRNLTQSLRNMGKSPRNRLASSSMASQNSNAADVEQKEHNVDDEHQESTPPLEPIRVGKRVHLVSKRLADCGVVRFMGRTGFARGIWVGIELDEPLGKNDGTVKGKRYFTCAESHGVFVQPQNVLVVARSGEVPAWELFEHPKESRSQLNRATNRRGSSRSYGNGQSGAEEDYDAAADGQSTFDPLYQSSSAEDVTVRRTQSNEDSQYVVEDHVMSPDGTVTEPRWVHALSTSFAIEVACGTNFACVLTREGRLFTWGQNDFGQLGLGHDDEQAHPTMVDLGAESVVKSMAVGEAHVLVITGSNNLYAWGRGCEGQLGLDREIYDEPNADPSLVDAFPGKALSIAAGRYHSAGVTDDGEVYTWGEGDSGQLGLGDLESQRVPTLVTSLGRNGADVKVVQVTCGAAHTVALTETRAVYVWGNDQRGANPKLLPQNVDALSGSSVRDLCCGSFETYALCRLENPQDGL
ncbi:Protein kinase, putative [Hondaea fermentalgiana]|uniref:non-specific serine/threonine protein kinase n=1 Tax=Hondaea fermentalgiana TaxID=2315210 RepID=A0A2R5GAW6_9STRA|nr:Protein kinase, putative [Hondaea fermentalgiana]|eukprot:GBG27735.1 Protein kinase, putative [Hondaea fermentalgiana]